MAYLFGAWNNFKAFTDEGQEGLLLDPLTNEKLEQPNYVGNYNEDKLRREAEWYEVDPSLPLLEQVKPENLIRYVNENAIEEYKVLSEDILQNLDLGGVFEKDRIKPTDDPSGIFDFSLASPTLYRMVEWYVEELDELVDGDFVQSIDMGNGNINFYTFIDGKNYRVRRQQKGTYEILNNVPNAELILVSQGMFATKPSSGKGLDGKVYRLKFATKNKKIYLTRPKKGGAPQYLDVFIPIGGLAELDSNGMLSKVAPILMVAQQMEEAGVKVRIYGLRTYDVENDTIFYSWVAKEYGAKLDLDAIAVATADPRFFRWTLWQTSEGITRKRFKKELTGYGRTLTDANQLNNVFMRFKNYLWDLKNKGLFDTKVNDKSLLIVGGLLNPSNNFNANRRDIEDEFYRVGDVAELVLAKDVNKAVRRIISREKNLGRNDYEIRNRLVQEINQAFQVVPRAKNEKFYTPEDELFKIQERRDKIVDAIEKALI